MYSFLTLNYWKVDAASRVCKHAEQHCLDGALIQQLQSNGKPNQILQVVTLLYACSPRPALALKDKELALKGTALVPKGTV